jgi:proteasome activator subunit 4
MKRELVKSMRTVALLAMFSQDSSVVNNIQGCLKSMCVMEPDLILEPILQRAVPSLEALTEVRAGRTPKQQKYNVAVRLTGPSL